MVNLLALDTSTTVAAVAIGTAAGEAHGIVTDPSQRHGRNLLPAIRDLLHTAGVPTRALDGVAVALGPGSYTGLRVGVTAANVLAYALGIPVVGLDSLEVLARSAPLDAPHVAAIADAQRGDLYAAEFARQTAGGPLFRVAPTRIEPQDAWLDRLVPGTTVVGPGIERLRCPLPDQIASARTSPEPLALLAVAHDAWASGRRDDPWLLEPLYLRRSAAEEQWDRKTGTPRP